MTEPEKVYVDSCAFIDLVKFETGNAESIGTDIIKEREKDVFFLRQLLNASRANDVTVITSSVTITECLQIAEGQAPSPSVQRFFSELLTSGKSGVKLCQPTQAIMELARDLRWKHGINLKPMDAIHAATALKHNSKEILTRDTKIVQYRERLLQIGLSVVPPSGTSSLPHEYLQQNLPHEE